jgi:hypothetical protein
MVIGKGSTPLVPRDSGLIDIEDIVIPGASRNGELVPVPGGVSLGKLMKSDGD